MPDRFVAHRYMSLVHGAGLCGEYPYIPYPQDFARKGYDGLIEENMTLCVESLSVTSTAAKGSSWNSLF
jgi:hypothetical protein